VHATALQAGFDHQFVATFGRPIGNGQTGSQKSGVLHLRFPLFKVAQVGQQRRRLRLELG
jgi:hypothetical protein